MVMSIVSLDSNSIHVSGLFGPMDAVIGQEHVILVIYPFPLTCTLPQKLCCRKMLVLNTAQFTEGLKQSSPEMPPDLAEVFQGCNQTPWKSFAAFWRCAHTLGTLIEPCSTKSTLNFTLLWAVPQLTTPKILWDQYCIIQGLGHWFDIPNPQTLF